jgi:hypothetical protein
VENIQTTKHAARRSLSCVIYPYLTYSQETGTPAILEYPPRPWGPNHRRPMCCGWSDTNQLHHSLPFAAARTNIAGPGPVAVMVLPPPLGGNPRYSLMRPRDLRDSFHYTLTARNPESRIGGTEDQGVRGSAGRCKESANQRIIGSAASEDQGIRVSAGRSEGLSEDHGSAAREPSWRI